MVHCVDPHDGRSFLIPPGGGVEFGETLEAAVRRELREELGTGLLGLRRLGMIENFYRYNGADEHELVFVYEAEPDNHALRVEDGLVLTEANGHTFPVRWHRAEELRIQGLPLVPSGLADLIPQG